MTGRLPASGLQFPTPCPWHQVLGFPARLEVKFQLDGTVVGAEDLVVDLGADYM